MSLPIPLPSDPSTSQVYPDWVRAHDPGAEPAARALFDALCAGARAAHAKPGAFLDTMQRQARRLPPSHLPWFWEAVAHRLIPVHPRSAARAHTLARKAEHAHRLPADPDRHRANVLLHARHGALAAADLSGHQPWLAGVLEPAAAHEEYVRVLTAWPAASADLPADLATRVRASARAAGLGTAEDARILGPLVAAARGRAVPDRLLLALAKLLAAHPPAEELYIPLLDLFPESRADAAPWLRLLRDSGAAAAAAAGRAVPEGGLGDWLRRYARAYRRRKEAGGVVRQPAATEILQLVPLFAPRLKAAGTPVRLHEDRYGYPGLDADLLDACLAAGIPVEDPGPAVRLDFWGERSRRDLTALAADPVFGPRLEGTVHAGLRGAGTAITRLPENPGIAAEVRHRVESLLDALRGGGLAAADEAVNELRELLDRPTATALDGVEEALAGIDLTGPLARALHAGLPEELGWPALDAALAGFPPGESVQATSTWPVLTVYGATRATAVDHEGERASCTFRVPGDAVSHSVHYAGGDFLVAWSTDERATWGSRAFWASRPEDVFTPRDQHGLTPYGGFIHGGLGYHFETADGAGRHDGERVLRPGSREGIGGHDLMAGDGQRMWSASVFHAHDRRAPVDPHTGERIGDGPSPRIGGAAEAPDGWRDSEDLRTLAPLPEGAPSSPLGRDGRLVGCRVLHRVPWSGHSPREFRLEAADGRRADYRTRTWGRRPWGILALPAGGEDAVLVDETAVRCHSAADNSLLWQVRGFPGAPGSDSRAARTAPTLGEEAGPVPPPAFWHFLAPCDEAASKALRTVGATAVRALLDAALRGDPRPALPGIAEPRIADGVARAARLAADVLRRRRDLSRRVALLRSGPVADLPFPVPDTVLAPALRGLLPEVRGYGAPVPAAHPALLTAVAADGRHLRGEIDDETRRLAPPAQPAEWAVLVGGIGAAAWRAAVTHTDPEERAALAALLEVWSRQPFAEPGSAWRTGRAPEEAVEACRAAGGILASGAPRRGLVRFLQPAADPAPDGAEETRTAEAADDARRLPRLLALLAEKGPLAVPADAVEAFCRRTGARRSIGLLVLAGLPARERYDDHRALLRKKPYRLTLPLVREYDDLVHRLGEDGRRALLAAGVPDDPAELWEPGGMTAAAGRMAEVWAALLGATEYVDEELAEALEAEAGLGGGWARALPAGRASGAFGEHGFVLAVHPSGRVRVHLVREDGTPGDWVSGTAAAHTAAATAIVWALTERPVGDPAAAGALRLYGRVRAVLDDPGTLVPVLYPPAPALAGAPGFAPYEGPLLPCPQPLDEGVEEPQVLDDGLFVVETGAGTVFVRTAALADPERVERAARLCTELRLDHLRGRLLEMRDELDGLARIAARAAAGPVPAGGCENDPALSAPDLVAEVARTLGTGADAAALYLQLLALARPTDAGVRRWNGWTAARHKAARAELVAAGAVVAGSRARAGRSVFVPGEWTDLKAPHLPLETAKTGPHLARVYGKDVHSPYLRLLAPLPPHELFAQAWEASRTAS
ncbi:MULTISPECIES: hypothetical protein [Streptomyces]|uniref:hypothetical protein n=1 Tax=Streptomyces TaxID=1883 RepID=UPI001674D330|nr:MULTISPECIES: hypothetical protein [Streptomyces]MBD3575676.1 hypothetical protein [Streptomyces sp. KD18]GGT24651.1 hypothetical protein GCM10010286_57550 [Streptomyces toxytricini]